MDILGLTLEQAKTKVCYDIRQGKIKSPYVAILNNKIVTVSHNYITVKEEVLKIYPNFYGSIKKLWKQKGIKRNAKRKGAIKNTFKYIPNLRKQIKGVFYKNVEGNKYIENY